MSFWKLINFELKRLVIPFVAMVVLTAVIQLIGVYVTANRFVDAVKDVMDDEKIPNFEQFALLKGESTFSHAMDQSIWITAPVLLCIAFLIIYLFFTWYREWLGRRSFIVRLLTLPNSRMIIYWSKLVSFLLAVFGLVAAQLPLLKIEQALYYQLVPDVLVRDFPVDISIANNTLLNILLPPAFSDFMLFYGVGIAAVLVLTTIILLERSYRIVGIIVGLAYGTAVFFLFLMPVIMLIDRTSRFFPKELLAMGIGVVIFVAALSIWWSSFLLRKKITV
ncbi:hypothetical protein [Paenibacillus sp. MMS18-CY102]|uniref:hypothetical protein n=1 Tax=Paenibacillus sp. MMS18-CY102 TaxID=2682849 RepID=UPI001365B8DB|nr:hypothetical protein [Paenibacillus sp. MMS18-CY102]MWC27431.1 hypothetical protein [Paenibacillus sp. MMS18-CY102]